MKRTFLLLIGGICLTLLSACAGNPAAGTTAAAPAATAAETPAKETAAPADTTAVGTASAGTDAAAAGTKEAAAQAPEKVEPQEETQKETQKETQAETQEAEMEKGAERSLKIEDIDRVVFSYEWFNKYSLRAYVTVTPGNGAEMETRKTVGPMNYTGFQKEGIIKLDEVQMAELRAILGRYDIEGMSRLLMGTDSGPSRSLCVSVGEKWYDIPSGTEFPVTIPPVEDIMYFELYNFFNDRISSEPGWEEVRSDDLEDPRDNPAYSERKVNQFGNMVRLEPGTGADYDTGKGARIDYGEKIWWKEEGFTGTWTITEDDRKYRTMSADQATLTVDDDGSVKLVLDGEEWTGRLGDTRYYLDPISLNLSSGAETRPFSIWNLNVNSYGELSIDSHPGPVPMPQFPDTYIRVSDPERKEREAEARRAEEESKIRYNADGSWICEECGGSNTGDFCSTCGKPKPGTRTGDSRPYEGVIPQTMYINREVWPADGHLPTLEEVLKKEEKHGPLTEVLWSWSRSGMLMGDYTRSSLRLYRENGEWRLMKTEMPSFQEETFRIYAADDEVYDRLQVLADQNNLSAWSFLKTEPEQNKYIYDMTDKTSLSLTFDDSSIGAMFPEIRTIDPNAVPQDGKKVLDEVHKILEDCVKEEKLIETGKNPNPYAPSAGNSGKGGAEAGTAADGTWTCPDCGQTGNGGKFCTECGRKRPE